MTEDAARDVDEWAAPQIGLLAEFMAAKPFDPMTLSDRILDIWNGLA